MPKWLILLAVLSFGVLGGCQTASVNEQEAQSFGKPSEEDAKKEAAGVKDDRE